MHGWSGLFEAHPVFLRRRVPLQENLSNEQGVRDGIEHDEPHEALAEEPRALAPNVTQMKRLMKNKYGAVVLRNMGCIGFLCGVLVCVNVVSQSTDCCMQYYCIYLYLKRGRNTGVNEFID